MTEQPLPWRAAVLFAAGCGCLSIGLFWASLIGFTPGVVSILMIVALAAMPAFLFRLRSIPQASPEFAAFSRADAVCLGVVALAAAFVAYHALGTPLHENDAIAIWGLKAKVVTLEPVRASAYFQDVTKSFSHLDYPLGFPFLTSAVYALIGRIDDTVGKIILPFAYLAMIMILHLEIRRRLVGWASASLVITAAFTPALIRWAGAGTADIILVLYASGALVSMIRWMEGGRLSDASFATCFAASCLFTKNEGLPLAIILFGSAAVWMLRERRSQLAWMAAACALISIPWLVFLSSLPQTHESYWSQLSLSRLIDLSDRLPLIARELGAQIVDVPNWGGLWILLIAAAVIGRRAFARPAARFLWTVFVLNLCLYFLAYWVTPWNAQELIGATFERLCMHLVPAAILLIAMHLGSFLEGAAVSATRAQSNPAT